MNFLPKDDLRPLMLTQEDKKLHLELEKYALKQFYNSCDDITQELPPIDSWHISIDANNPTLTIQCSSIVTYEFTVDYIVEIASKLEEFAGRAKICVNPPLGCGKKVEITISKQKY
jgi:hypothetical protein